jgi:hypothetical protein
MSYHHSYIHSIFFPVPNIDPAQEIMDSGAHISRKETATERKTNKERRHKTSPPHCDLWIIHKTGGRYELRFFLRYHHTKRI